MQYLIPPSVLTSTDQHGRSLLELSHSPLLLVCLRHFGCTFCREAVADIVRDAPELASRGVAPAFVHMSSEEKAAAFFARYGAQHLSRISDPEQRIYEALSLPEGSFRQLFGWKSWARGFEAGILNGHGVGLQEGNGFRMPGVFLLHHGQVLKAFVHESAADRPDYCALANPDTLI